MKSTVIVLQDNFAAVRDAITGPILMEAAKAGGHVIEGAAKVNASSGRPGLNIKTGALVGSITVEPAKSTNTFAEVDIGPSVLYARIHEFGGIIVPVHAPRLSWIDETTGEFRSAYVVQIPARPYMRPAVDENEDNIANVVAYEIRRSLEAAA